METNELESTDAAPEVLHPRLTRPTRDTTSNAVAHASVRVYVFFFFFFWESRRLGSICANATRFVPNRANSAKIGLYRPFWVVLVETADIAETGRKWPKSTLNMAGKAETFLLRSFFCESRHSNVFFKNMLIVKIYRKYK